MHEALAKAHERIVQLVLERDSERFMRLDAEAKVQSGRQGRDAAMRALQQAMQAFRKLKTEAADREDESEKLNALLETERSARERGPSNTRVRTCRGTRATFESQPKDTPALLGGWKRDAAPWQRS
jgi:hypothetical protein